MSIIESLKNATNDFKIQLNDEQLNQFQIYYEMLVDWNTKINLTAITQPNDVAIKHFADSLTMLNYIDIPINSKVIDVGTGAGFPGLALKIARPDINLTLLDSLNKRLNFLAEVCNAININANLVHSRAEDGAKNVDLRENFDFSVSRAVAQLNVLTEYCVPYVKVGGSFIAMKGPNANDEVLNANNATQILGAELKNIYEFSLPIIDDKRTIIEYKKIMHTPNIYPRKSSRIKSKSL